MDLTENALKILEKRYLIKDQNENVIEKPTDLFRRVAKTVAQAENKYTTDKDMVDAIEEKFYDIMTNLLFLPNSPTLMNAGRPLGQLSACFVLPVENDVMQILRTVKNTAIIHKSGGGTGFNVSKVKLAPVLQKNYLPIFVLDENHPDSKELKETLFSHASIYVSPSTVPFPKLNIGDRLVIEDTMESIFDIEKLLKMPEVIDFSKVRPHKSRVNTTGGEASGPVSFMKVWNEAIKFLTNEITPITFIKLSNMCTEVVKQGGTRRGANMGIVNIDCEYIEEFITCKQDGNEITNFNISVGFVDGFWESYINNTTTEPKKWGLKDYSTGKIVKIVDPIALFNKISDNAWKNGEPGIIFLDKINSDNPVNDQEVESTNPCVTGDTLVLTDKGYHKIKNLVGDKVNVWNGEQFSEVIPEITGHNQEILEISFSDGSKLNCTPYHGFYLKDTVDKIKAEELKVNDKLQKFTFPVIEMGETIGTKFCYTSGFFSGDGSVEISRERNSIWLYGEKRKLLPYLIHDSSSECSGDKTFVKISSIIMLDKKYVPSIELSVKSRLDWLAGAIDSDGSLNSDDGAISISSVNKKFLNDIKLMLNTLGCTAVLSIMKEEMLRLLPDGKGGQKVYPCQKCYRITISASNVKKLMILGLCTNRVPLKADPNRDASQFIRVVGIKRKGIKKNVYCFNEPLLHKGCFNGILTANCGEQPLLPYEACNLGSINLALMIKDDDNGKLVLDKEKLSNITRTATRFLDNVIDINKYPIPEIDEMTRKYRKIGLGVMGWAHMLYIMGIPYNSQKALDLAEEVMSTIQLASHRESEDLAKERGPFPGIDKTKFGNKYKGLPRRNATTTTIAPTGTLSIIASVSGGIEPEFALSYIRNSADEELCYVNWIFDDAYQETSGFNRENPVYKNVMKTIAKKGTLHGISGLPKGLEEIFVTSHDISVEWHIKMQAAFQKYTDNAVSKTINMTKDATREDVMAAYTQSRNGGCKGITVYRDGSRENQVLNVGNIKSEDVTKNISEPTVNKYGKAVETRNEGVMDIFPSVKTPPTPRPRPEITTGFTEKVKIGCGNLYVTVNYDNEGICEVFTNTGRTGGCPSQSEATARLVSLSLRSGIDVSSIVGQLKGIRCPSTIKQNGLKVLSCPDAIGRLIEKVYKGEINFSGLNTNIENKSGVIDSDCENNCNECAMKDSCNKPVDIIRGIDDGKFTTVCPECNENVEHEGGCVICRNCGWGKCG